jgi:hypothetical protein
MRGLGAGEENPLIDTSGMPEDDVCVTDNVHCTETEFLPENRSIHLTISPNKLTYN